MAKPLILVAMLVFMGFLVFGKGMIYQEGSKVSAEPKDIQFTKTTNDIQEIVVKPTEYSPNNILLKAGTPSILNFKTEKLGCTGIVLSEELGFNVTLKENTNNYVNIKALEPGTYHYSCGMGMFKGTLTVTN